MKEEPGQPAGVAPSRTAQLPGRRGVRHRETSLAIGQEEARSIPWAGSGGRGFPGAGPGASWATAHWSRPCCRRGERRDAMAGPAWVSKVSAGRRAAAARGGGPEAAAAPWRARRVGSPRPGWPRWRWGCGGGMTRAREAGARPCSRRSPQAGAQVLRRADGPRLGPLRAGCDGRAPAVRWARPGHLAGRGRRAGGVPWGNPGPPPAGSPCPPGRLSRVCPCARVPSEGRPAPWSCHLDPRRGKSQQLPPFFGGRTRDLELGRC